MAKKAAATPAAKPSHSFPRFNVLPTEIQKRIFEIAYISESLWDSALINSWIFVSHKVRERIEPFIYASIVLPEDFEHGSDRKRLERYERTFQSRPKEFYAKSVKRFYTNNKSRGSDFEIKLRPICDNLVSLECWSNPKEELITILKTKEWPKLKTLCLNIDLLPKDENIFCFPLFQHVTHLDLSSNKPHLLSWKSLESLEHLTHMRVYMFDGVEPKAIARALDQANAIASGVQGYLPPNLKHFVILVPVDLLYYISSMECKTPEERNSGIGWKGFGQVHLTHASYWVPLATGSNGRMIYPTGMMRAKISCRNTLSSSHI